jgi:hypothetical protein
MNARSSLQPHDLYHSSPSELDTYDYNTIGEFHIITSFSIIMYIVQEYFVDGGVWLGEVRHEC